MPTERPAQLRLSFPEAGASALADLLWDAAPQTCAAVVSLLPTRGVAHQAIYSGSETVMRLEQLTKLDKEHATWEVRRGDLAFTWIAAGSAYNVNEDFAELCWFYDHDARPSMWEGPVAVNVFARIVEPADAFYQMCRRIRREGIKPITVEVFQP
ncbi:MAG: DUF3830 family protein [Planctomycetales bacterium]